MGNFGTVVTSLLDTYTKCLSLLKGTRNPDDGTLSDTHSTLSASLRSDRARVRRVYASRLSKDGSRFEKGDAPARSALRRIIKKLTSTLTNIVSHDGKQQPVRYESLLALSNGSSIEAVRTMNDLSSRVGSRSTISQGSVTLESPTTIIRRSTSPAKFQRSTALTRQVSDLQPGLNIDYVIGFYQVGGDQTTPLKAKASRGLWEYGCVSAVLLPS
ncbi:hypothetical protein FPSE_09118 [Fusarium pseudograminearum CS3096]|uniref:Uncharacterized protein n=1 Tax=Fusarium pseudograminearum (strain CS3096) TaxID=1028729 RepID=K3VDK0_FUSPC|nr:hypothetical protein FPSE_09118 [Fusarium pseudograminearum CS3096]EKJ70608.1 hypothetical protein FPSE_09118 [Fusarium pseudograminearum CS3096]